MTTPQVKAVPDGTHTVTPHLICVGAADAIEFYKKAFNAVELARLPDPQGKIFHAHIRIGDSSVMLVDEFPDWGGFGPKTLKGSPVTIHLYVEMSKMSTRSLRKPSMREQKSPCHWKTRFGAIGMGNSKTPLAIIGRSPHIFAT